MKKYLSVLLVPLTALSLLSAIAPVSAQAQTSSASCYTFTRNLGEGRPISTQEAAALAQDLSSAGVWNSGTPITSYTDAIASAVSGFQEKYAAQILTPNGLSYGTGFVGVSTRTQLNSLYGCSTSTTQPIQSFHCPVGYTCAPVNQNPIFTCPAGYTCTPATTPTNPTTPTQPVNPITNQQSYLYVLSPNGGESYAPGQTVSIQFSTNITSQQDPDGFKIMLLYGANSTNLQQFNVSQQTLVSNYTGTSPYQWTIPSSLPSGNYTIYIVSNDFTPDGAQHADGSDNYFTIGTQQTQTCPAGQTWNSSWGSCSVQVQSNSGQPYVKIISPDGGETYSPGQVVPISFSTNLTSQQAPSGFNIWAYYGGNSTNVGSYASGVQSIAMSYTGSSPYNWTVPSSWSTGNYVIYIVPASVVGVSNTGLFAFGDSYFTISGQTTQTPTCSSGQTWNGSSCISSNQPLTVSVQSPTSGQTFNTGSSLPITWTSTGASNLTATILLERFDDKANAGSPVTVKSITTTNSGSYTLSLGSGDINTLFPCPNGCSSSGSASFDVRVILATTGTPNAQSSRFTISGSASAPQATVSITAPNGGTFQAGTPVTIQWTATGINSSNNSLGLAVYETSLGSTHSLLSTTVSNTGSYSWTIPTTAPSGTDYIVYMSTSNTYAQSNPFRIIPQQIIPTITVTSPNGGENWQVGSTYPITWTAANLGQNVTSVILTNYMSGSANYLRQYVLWSGGSGINYSDSNGSGSYSWTIPSSIPAGQYKMGVDSSNQGNDTYDASDGTFTITASQ